MKVEELEEYFKSCELPESIQLEQGVRIVNIDLFLKTSLDALKARGLVPSTTTYYDRLIRLKDALEILSSNIVKQ